MDSLSSIKNRFSHDYNEAIDNYNNGDLILFFRNIRPAIEAFCKLVIYDLVGPQLAEELLSGSKAFDYNYRECTAVLSSGRNRDVENSMLATLALQTIYHKKGDTLALYNEHRKVERIKRAIDSDFNKLISDFKSSSEAGSHDGKSTVDNEIEAKSLSTFMPKVFSDLKSILSNDIIDFLASLKKPLSNVVFQDPTSKRTLAINNDLLVFDELTNRLEQSADINYVVLLPCELKDSNGNILKGERLKDFFKLKWNFILDLDPKSANGLYENAPSEIKSSTRIITDSISEVSGSQSLTNWLFGRGRMDLNVFDDKKTLRETPKLFANSFSKLVKTGKTSDYIIIDFCDSFPKLSRRLYDKLEDVFGSWESVSNRCKVFSFTLDNEYRDDRTSWADDVGVPVNFVSASFGDFLNHIVELRPNTTSTKTNRLLIHNNIDLSESRERYKAAGIEFFGPSLATISEGQKTWDFYSGAEITWDELDKQYDVTRDIYRAVKMRVTEIIRTTRRTTIYTLRHRPGSGATTLSRRLAYDIRKDDEIGGLSCTVIEIKNCSNIRLTEQYLCQLSEQTDNTVILAIVESKHVGREKFDNLVKRMSDAGKKVLFFYVEPYTGQYYTQKENVILLDSALKLDEFQRFNDKYLSLGLDKALLDNAVKDAIRRNKNLEVVDYPLMLRDKETSDNLSTYVNEWMDELPDNLRKFCAYVAFVFKYSNQGVNQTILKSLWKDEFHLTIRSYTSEQKTAISKLLIEEMAENGDSTGVWRPRYNRFSDFILASFKSNWESSLSTMAKDFIGFCKEAGELGSDDKDMLYSIFIIRKEADYRAVEDKGNIRNKFSVLIKDLNDVERAESLFQSLVSAFPEDSVFRGHYSRFLYEKANMQKWIDVYDRLFIVAQDNLNIALSIDPADADLHHMQGMLLRRRIGALSKMFNHDVQNKRDDINIQEIEDCLHEWTRSAYDAFERSIKYSPASPYGYAAESQLFKESISFGKKLLGCDDYSFCETNSIYADYSDQLGNVLDLFEQICYAFKNEGLSQIMNSYPIYESVRAFHQNIIGHNSESIKRYRSMYKNASNDKKSIYGTLLVKSIIYSKKSSKDTRKAYFNLTKSERTEIEHILEYQKNIGDIKSYENLFLLKLYGPDEFSLDETIDLLKEWENQFDDEYTQSGWGYLNVCFYLAVCYCAKAIQAGVLNKELSSLAMTYFRKSETLAKKFDKGTVNPLCYFGEKEDIHCIVDKNKKDTEATTITGVIRHINNNKGLLEMSCGVEVSFNAKGFDILHHEGQVLRGVLGFKYSGPGLYDFRPDSDRELSAMYYDSQEEKEITNEELEQSYVPIEDMVEEPKEQENTTDIPQYRRPDIKIVGKVDLPNEQKNKTESSSGKKNKHNKPRTVSGVFLKGIYGKSDMVIQDITEMKQPIRSIREGETIIDGDKVEYLLCSEPNSNDPTKKFWYAEDVHLKE